MIVKIDNPRGNYYGGLTAAPVTRTMLQQALASRRVAIDRSRLAPQEDDACPRSTRRRRQWDCPRGALLAVPARLSDAPAADGARCRRADRCARPLLRFIAAVSASPFRASATCSGPILPAATAPAPVQSVAVWADQ